MINWYIFATNIPVHEILHLISALVVSFFIYRLYKSWKLVAVAFLVSFLIDLDHLTEAFLVYGINPLKVVQQFHGNHFLEAGKITVFFHSWEALPFILLLGKVLRLWPLAVSIVLAAVCHYLVDNFVYGLFYGMPLWQYSFIYRAIYNFDYYKLCRGC